MPTRYFLATLPLLAMILAPATMAFAQNRDPLRQSPSIPLDLATALAAAGGFGNESDPQILVGELPEWVATRMYVPAGSRVLGSAFLGTTVVGIVSVPTSSDTLMKHFERELQQRGWRAPPALQQYMGGGFRPATITVAARVARRVTLCGDRQALSAWISRQQAASTTVVMRLTASGNAGVCNPMQYPGDMQRSPLPTLYNPEGAADARMGGGGDCSSTGRSHGTSTILQTTLTPDALLEHYGRQMQDSGWTPTRNTPAIVGRIWTRPDSAGALTQISLTVATSPGDSTCRAMELNLRTPRKP